MFSWRLCSFSLFQRHNGSERDGCLGHRLFIPGAIGCCKTRFLATGRGWRIRLEQEKRREGGSRHGYTPTQIATWNWSSPDNWLADWLAACSATTRNNSTTHTDPCWHKNLAWLIDILEINMVSGSCLPALLSCWPLKVTFLCFDRVRKRER